MTGQRQERMLLVMGFACSSDGWLPLLNVAIKRPTLHPSSSHPALVPQGEAITDESQSRTLQVVVFDNRGIGKSSCPASLKLYSTTLMADDAVALMDHLGWSSAHVVGHSLGGMISAKLASRHPTRVSSLTIISSTGGGMQAIPLKWEAVRYLWSGLMARTPQTRAAVDVRFHFCRATRKGVITARGCLVEDVIVEEYVANGVLGTPQHADGQRGQLHAVTSHALTDAEASGIRNGAFVVKVIHGTHDIIALPHYGQRLARRLGTVAVMVEGAHFSPRENAREVWEELVHTMRSGPKPSPSGLGSASVLNMTASTASQDRKTRTVPSLHSGGSCWPFACCSPQGSRYQSTTGEECGKAPASVQAT
ncbi:MAG: hypothetical protein WDW36_005003 [Sanguina aurantia]